MFIMTFNKEIILIMHILVKHYNVIMLQIAKNLIN